MFIFYILYLFDSKFSEKVPQLGMDYRLPGYFSEDLFNVLGDERPDYRWIIIGPYFICTRFDFIASKSDIGL